MKIQIRSLSRTQRPFKHLPRAAIVKHNLHPRERRRTLKMSAHLLQHHLRTSLNWKTGDPGTDRRERNRLERVLIRPLQRIPSLGPQIRLRRRFPKPHARGMNHMPRLEIARTRNRRLAERNRADSVAFFLDRRPALDSNR